MKGVVVVVVVALAGCPPSAPPTPADTAAYLGLADGATLTYEVSEGINETHALRQSSILPGNDNPGGLVFDMIATQNGFAVASDAVRSFSIEVSLTDAKIVRFGDCIVDCGQPSGKIPIGAVPLTPGEQNETEVDVATTRNGADSGTVRETHTFVVGDQAAVSVPAGDFDAFIVSWTRTDDDGATTSIIKVAPDQGIVSWDGFDSAQLRLAN